MSRRTPWIALVAAIVLLAGLVGTAEVAHDGPRTLHLRAADGSPSISGTLRAHPVPARRDRIPLGVHASLVPTAIRLEPPERHAVGLEMPPPAAAAAHRPGPRPRARAPPRS